MRYLLEHLAVVFGAATGALAARGKGIDLFGVVVLGLVAAVGGGTLRDVVLDAPVFWVQDSTFILSGTVAAGAMFYFARFVDPSSKPLLIVDAFSLAFVATLGTHKTYGLNHAGTVCVVFGVVTGVAGGMIRDVLLGEVPLVFRPNIYLYATAALIGATAYLGAATLWPDRPTNLVIGAAVILALRLAAIRWRWKLPVFHTQNDGVA
ncbi:MAG: TRIC cation channel family protein [Candidatus Saccharimonas sp.]|nr:TRIC cation channel family protein [Planctomycetaceae bacterium]